MSIYSMTSVSMAYIWVLQVFYYVREKIKKFWSLTINKRKISLYYISDIVLKKYNQIESMRKICGNSIRNRKIFEELQNIYTTEFQNSVGVDLSVSHKTPDDRVGYFSRAYEIHLCVQEFDFSSYVALLFIKTRRRRFRQFWRCWRPRRVRWYC